MNARPTHCPLCRKKLTINFYGNLQCSTTVEIDNGLIYNHYIYISTLYTKEIIIINPYKLIITESQCLIEKSEKPNKICYWSDVGILPTNRRQCAINLLTKQFNVKHKYKTNTLSYL